MNLKNKSKVDSKNDENYDFVGILIQYIQLNMYMFGWDVKMITFFKFESKFCPIFMYLLKPISFVLCKSPHCKK